MCTPPPPQPLPTIAAPGQPARAGACVRTHGPRRRPRSPFLASGAAAAPLAGLPPPGDPPPSDRVGPEWPRSLLSAAGGRVATFVNCKQTHVVLQQSRPCLVLVAFPPALPPPPSRGGFLPLPPSSLSLGSLLQGSLGGLGRAWGRGAGGYNAATPRLRARGGRGAGWCACLQGAGLQGGRGACSRGVRGWAGPEGPALPAGGAADLGTLAAALSLAARAWALFTSEAWT